MTHTAHTPASPTDGRPVRSRSDEHEKRALAPDTRTLDPRAARAWTEPMAVAAIGGGCYAVESDGGSYVVDLVERRCTCPDSTYRGERCKHLRRVALEITRRALPAPGFVAVSCRACGTDAFVHEDAAPLCEDCRFDPGDVVRDRETGDLLLVVASTDDRADETALGDGTVADHPTNADYPRDDPLVRCVYPFSGRSDQPRSSLKRYAFPHSRLERDPTAAVQQPREADCGDDTRPHRRRDPVVQARLN